MTITMTSEELSIVQDILRRRVPHHAVWVFGSRAKGTTKKTADLDLAIISDNPLSLTELGKLHDEFDISDLPFKVDIVDWATASESFRQIIERDKVILQEASH